MKHILTAFIFVTFIGTTCAAVEGKVFLNNDLALHDITLMTKDVQKLAAFYSKIGFGRHPHVNNENIVVFPMPGNDLAIHRSDKDSKVGVSFKIKNLDVVVGLLKKHNVKFEGPKQLRPGLTGVEFKDPIGNTVSFLTEKKK